MNAGASAARVARRVLAEPLVHFAVLGAALFALHAAVESSRPLPDAAQANVAAPARDVAIGAAELSRLRALFRASYKREPTPDELGDLVVDAIADEILFREGLALGLEREDAVVRQRVIEKMRALARPREQAAPTRLELERWFAAYPHRFRQRASVEFEQIYFDPRRDAQRGVEAATRAASALERLRAEPEASIAGDDFALSRRWKQTPEPQVVTMFGEAFARALMSAELGRWVGPWRSEYGLHLVRVAGRTPDRARSFEEAEPFVRADLQLAQARGLAEVERRYRPHYRVELTAPDARSLAHTPALRAWFARPQ